MNWELQLADAMTVEESHLLSGAQQAREQVRRARYGAALKILWSLLLPASRKRSGRQRAFLMLHMGHVYRHWMIDVAFKFFRDSRDLARESRFARGEMVAECSLGQLYLDWEEQERALVHFERGLALAESCASPWWQSKVLGEVVKCQESLGHTERARAGRRRIDLLDEKMLEDLWGRPEVRDPDLVVARREEGE